MGKTIDNLTSKSWLLALAFLAPILLSAQIETSVQVEKTTIYSTNNGLKVKCVDQVFFDQKGRMWLNPCNNIGKELGIDSYQFDGTKSMSYDFAFLKENPQEIQNWAISGQTKGKSFFGSNYKNNLLFIWNQETNTSRTFPLEKDALLLNLTAHPENGFLALVQTEGAIELIHYTIEQAKSITKILCENTLKELGPLSYALDVIDGKAIFFVDRQGLASVNLETSFTKILDWKSTWPELELKQDTLDVFNHKFQWKPFALKHELLLYLGQKNGYYIFNPHSLSLKAHTQLNALLLKDRSNPLFLKTFFAKDKHNRLLINTCRLVSSQEEQLKNTDFELVVLNSPDSIINYSEVIKEPGIITDYLHFQTETKFFGTDFTNSVGWIFQEGMVICSLKKNYAISSFPLESGARAIEDLNDSCLLVNTDLSCRKLNKKTGQLDYFELRDFHENGLTPFHSKDGKVWGSLEEGGLFSFDKKTKAFTKHLLDQKFDKFDFLTNDSIAFFTRTGALYFGVLSSGKTYPVSHNGQPFTLNSFVNEFLISKKGELMVAAQNGLWIINPATNTFEQTPVLANNTNGNILSVSQSETNPDELWLGFSKEGVVKYNIKTGTSVVISENEGLSNNSVIGIIVDDNNYKWAATFHGINIIDTNGKVIYVLEKKDGLSNDEYNRMAYAKLDNGLLAFGSIEGLDIINPKKLLYSIKQSDLNLYLNRVEYYDADIKTTESIQGLSTFQKPLEINAENRFLLLDFGLSEYTDLENQTFYYRIIPSSENPENVAWSNLGNSSNLRLNSLAPGEYSVQIKGANKNLVEAQNILAIPIVVNDFFYKTWSFYALCLLVIGLTVFFFYGRLLLEKKKLDGLVKLRTARIEEDKVLITEQSDRIKNLYELSTNLYTQFSHELKTPLTVISGMAESISGNEKAKELIQRNAQTLVHLVHQILELKRIETEKLEPEMVQSDLVFFVKATLESFQTLAQKKRIKLSLKSEHEEMMLDFDEEKMTYILSNLISNALKYSGDESSVEINLNYTNALKNNYEICISDSGKGIAEKDLPHIFDRFYRSEEFLNSSIEGTGIGLAIVKEFVEFLNGSIEVTSKLNAGTTFHITLPATQDAPLKSKAKENIARSKKVAITNSDSINHKGFPTSSNKPTVLIIEDNEDVREYLLFCLKPSFNCLIAEDGKKGIELAMQSVPNIIVSDLLMPFANGLEVCNVLKNDIKTSHIPIVMLSAKADLDDRMKGLMEGADAYLGKPFQKKELITQLNALLQNRKSLHERYNKLQEIEQLKASALSREDKFVIELKNTILENMENEEFGVSELSKLMLLSRAQIHNKVKALTNKSTSGFIKQVRIEKACEILQTTDLTISEVSYKVGISNPSYFSKLFTEVKSISPKNYRATAK